MFIRFSLFLITALLPLISPVQAQDQAPAPATTAPASPAPAPATPPADAPPTPAPANNSTTACTITAAAPLETYAADGTMTGVSQSVVGQVYQCLRVENGKAVLVDGTGKTYKIRVDAISHTGNPTTDTPAVARHSRASTGSHSRSNSHAQRLRPRWL